jgi:uncharacterized protein with von Willebrand factor type A (vWA) domain
MTNPMDKIRAKLAAAADKIDAAKGRAAGPSWKPKKRSQFTRQIITTSRFDIEDWLGDEAGTIIGARKDKEIDDAIRDLFQGDLNDQESRPGYLNAPELMQDVFMTFLKPVPRMHKKHEVKKDARLNGKFIEQLMAMPDYERIHDASATDPLFSKMATVAVADAIKEIIKQHREQVKQANEERERDDNGENDGDEPGGNNPDSWDEETPGKGKSKGGQGKGDKGGDGQAPSAPGGHNKDQGGSSQNEDREDSADDGEDEAEAQPDWDYHDLEGDDENDPGQGSESDSGESDEVDGDGEDGEGGNDQLDDQEREFNEDYADQEYDTESNWEKMVDGVDAGRYLNEALQKAADEIEQLDESVKGVGLEPSEWKMMDPTQRMKIAAKLNTPRMKAIADMVGRMKRFAASQQAQKVIDAPHEIFTVEMGNDLRRVLRSEFAFLGTEETKIEFYRRYVEGTLLQYKERGHEDVGKGPIIICIDNSGSMSGAPENWAKGVAEALRRICQDQDRDFHAIYFETNHHRERFDFPKGKGPFEKIMAFLGISAGGGTEFDGVLTEALNKAQTMFDGEGKGKADIVFVTDGQAYLDQGWIDKFVEERDRIGCRIFGVYISAYDSSKGPAVRLMESFCNVVIPVKALEVNDEATATIFAQV